jgi:hypothetical protein
MPKRYPSSAETDAMVERVAPAILELLADGEPRSRRAIAAELADRHPKDEVARTLMRLAVTDQVAEIDRRYALAALPVIAAEHLVGCARTIDAKTSGSHGRASANKNGRPSERPLRSICPTPSASIARGCP